MLFDRIDYNHWLNQQRLSPRNCFQPIFEAIENAFNAVEESKRKRGKVEVTIRRDHKQTTLPLSEAGSNDGAAPDRPTGFIVSDNGIGLDTENWESFNTAFTPHKKSRGGKGVGRLTYLLAVKTVSIESRFKEDGKCLVRKLAYSADQMTDPGNPVQLETKSLGGTNLKLGPLRENVRQHFPRKSDVIAQHIVRHFFRRLTQTKDISFVLRDEWDDSKVDLRQLCERHFVYEQAPETIKILGKEFRVTHVRCNPTVTNRHEAMLCVGGRVVKERAISSVFTMTSKALTSRDGSPFFYVAFVESDVLDAVVRDDRTSFALDEEDEPNALPDPDAAEHPSIATIINAVGEAARNFLQTFIDPLQEKHRRRIEKFCRQNVIFRPLLKHRIDALLNIQVELSDAALEVEVSSIYHAWKSDLRARFNTLARTVRENQTELKAYRARYTEVLAELSEMAFHELANYVVDRRAVIDFLDDRMRTSANGKFRDEDAIHDVFFPRRTTSDDVAWDESNLWLIDERLAYQQFVASDLPFRKHMPIVSGSEARPDIAAYYDRAFDLTFAFGDGERVPSFTSVSLIEFKKPERTSFTETENPVAQIFRYIREIRKKSAVLDDGHAFRIHDSSPIHVFVVCHIVPEVLEYLKDHAYVRTPDGEGIIFHVPHHNAFVQFVSFEKLIADAKKRNDVFFRKLGIDEPSAPEKQIRDTPS